DHASVTQQFGRHLGARIELVQSDQVDDGEVFLVEVLEAGQLGQPHRERGLATLESRTQRTPGFETLGTAAGGLAALAALTSTDADLALLRTGSRLEVMELQLFFLVGHSSSSSRKTEVGKSEVPTLASGYFSSTSIRWRTLCSMPRTVGVSGCSTVWRILRRPSDSIVARALGFSPIRDRRKVTLSVLSA